MRVYELARELNLTSKELLNELAETGIEVKSHSSSLDADQADRIRKKLAEESSAPTAEKPAEEKEPAPATEMEKEEAVEKEADKTEAAPEPPAEAAASAQTLVVKFPVTVRELADQMGQKPNILIKKLLGLGVFAALNQFLDEETAAIVGQEYGFEIKSYSPPRGLQEEQPIAPPPEELSEEEDKTANLQPRAPVVTLMGHIDHGKTSILDAIRKSRITSKEAGGITQHIGAYLLQTGHGDLVFLDTPGHAAFTTMRARGAHLTDIVILVVAADDGIKPQTEEAIDHAAAAEVPIVVAINKIDKSTASPKKVKRQLAEKGLIPEDMGGETICAEVSALTEEGIDHLLEMLVIQSEIMELRADPDGPARGIVVEAKITPDRGVVATLLVQSGTLHRGDSLICDIYAGKVKVMFDDRGKTLKEAGPAVPVEILGLSGVPAAGSRFRVVVDDSEAREISERLHTDQQEKSWEDSKRVRLEDFFQQISEAETKELPLILKGDVQGSVEAVRMSLQEITEKNDDIDINILHSGVGAITESDIMLASASGAVIIGFQVPIDSKLRKMAEAEGIDVRLYSVIYQVIDEIKEALEGMLEPITKEKIMGRARVKEIFKISKLGAVAGSVVEKGKVVRGSRVRVIRDGVEVAADIVQSLRRFKEKVEEVSAGKECGISLANYNDYEVDDILESYQVEKTPQKL